MTNCLLARYDIVMGSYEGFLGIFESLLRSRLNQLSMDLDDVSKLARSIVELSQLFIREEYGKRKYWNELRLRGSYLSYFAFLNFLRMRNVLEEAKRLGFLDQVQRIADVGCGTGAASWALHSLDQLKGLSLTAVDVHPEALVEYKWWAQELEYEFTPVQSDLEWLSQTNDDCVILCYCLNEVEHWPSLSESIRHLILVEPSTHQAGRRLLEWRDELMRSGWFAWAPCTHQRPCPLLNRSGRDWCHHRFSIPLPEWFLKIEQFLPMKNRTLTYSYLLLSRNEPPSDLLGLTRVVGDLQEERGKSRQMICRGDQREFLSWLHRDGVSLKLERGDLVHFGELEVKANEVRVRSTDQVQKVNRQKGLLSQRGSS